MQSVRYLVPYAEKRIHKDTSNALEKAFCISPGSDRAHLYVRRLHPSSWPRLICSEATGGRPPKYIPLRLTCEYVCAGYLFREAVLSVLVSCLMYRLPWAEQA